MAKVDWPSAEKRKLIGKPIDRIDGPAKATGVAKYSYDINRPGMLWAKVVTSPYAHAEVTSIDTGTAEALPGVKGVDRKSTRLNSSHGYISYAVFCLKKKKKQKTTRKHKLIIHTLASSYSYY